MGKAIGYCRFQSPRTHIDLEISKHIFRRNEFLTASFLIQIPNTKVYRYSTNSGHINTGLNRGNEYRAEIFHKIPQEGISYVHK